MEGTGQHLLALKVMRVSVSRSVTQRPSLASAWEPFYSSSPSFSARSTASVVSLQGKDPLPIHPKSLRDLTNASDMLTLPSSFGAIQLGETFSSCLSVNNEAGVDISGVQLTMEIQTATTKVLLAELSAGSDGVLKGGDTLEAIVHHEIKELGQHVLACTVQYRLPPGARRPTRTEENEKDPSIQLFRKFYKFAVTNPLSVKTKVHLPRSPSSLLSRSEREKVFLEVHIQNLTQDALWFQRIGFECADGWNVEDINTAGDDSQDGLFLGDSALMQPQDMRQYIYILAPKVLPDLPITYAPGSVISLGRLDIAWRSSFGEPGRLLTSMLSRRIPLIAPTTPASALPLHMQKSGTLGGGNTPPRSRSPQPAYRPQTPPVSGRVQSPVSFAPRVNRAGTVPMSPPMSATTLPVVPSVSADLVVIDFPRDEITVDKPFQLTCRLTVSTPAQQETSRRPSFVIQHLLPIRTTVVGPPQQQEDTLRARWDSIALGSGQSTPSPTGTPPRGNFSFSESLAQRLLVASPRVMYKDEAENEGEDENEATVLPSPFALSEEVSKKRGASPAGASAFPLEMKMEGGEVASREFKLEYIAFRKGFCTVGGLRLLVVGDGPVASVVKEWEVIGEMWVR